MSDVGQVRDMAQITGTLVSVNGYIEGGGRGNVVCHPEVSKQMQEAKTSSCLSGAPSFGSVELVNLYDMYVRGSGYLRGSE